MFGRDACFFGMLRIDFPKPAGEKNHAIESVPPRNRMVNMGFGSQEHPHKYLIAEPSTYPVEVARDALPME